MERYLCISETGLRKVEHERNTNETKINIELNLDGNGKAHISTGLVFLITCWNRLPGMERLILQFTAKGDLHIDEHHTIEDTGIALG